MAQPEQKEEEQPKQLRGLYDRVNISVKSLNIIIVVLCAILVACLAFGVSNRGYDVTFDTLGGTSVESQLRMYGEYVEAPEPPSREGYEFSGWYLDEGLTRPWNLQEDTITGSITLYAGWKEK